MSEGAGRLRHRLLVALAAGLPVGVGGLIGIAADLGTEPSGRSGTAAVAGSPTPTAPVDAKVAAGAHDFVQFACAQCHGEQGRGGIAPAVPALTGVARTLTAA